ncbi:hypothetical protein MNBD_GAMMA02-184, partial [hydrothermal vent metagenome]
VQSKGSQSFTYDANGNNTQTTGFTNGSGITTSRNIEYTAFDKIQRVYTGSNLNPLEESTYRYNTSEQRFSRIDTNSDDETNTTHFIGNVEVEYNHNGQVAYKRQLGNYAVITETNQSTQETYLFNDHLGSVDVITDESGRLLQHMSFSAWGERRLPNSWDEIALPSVRDYLSDYTTRGFTGHEMLDAFGIINMGGRIYDAELGRVLQADPFVQEPTSSQSYNRYTYAFNNPLSFTDPSGFITLRQIIGIVAAIVVGYFLGPLGTTLWKAFWVGFASGFIGGIIITGSFKSALKSGLIAGAIAGISFAVGNGGASAADADAAVSGGVKENVTTNAYETANAASNSMSSATGSTLEQTATQTGSLSGGSVGVELGKITVTGATGPAGSLLADFAAEYWFEYALSIGSTGFLSDSADLVELDAESFPDGSLSRNNFENTAFGMRDVARMAQNILDDRAMTQAILLGAATTIVTSFIPIGRAVGWAKGAIEAKFKKIILKRTMQRVAATGRTGEAAVRAVHKIGDKKFFQLPGRGRIPDGVNYDLKTLSEVKNYAGKLSYTKQLRDFSAIAESKGLTFNLYVREATTFTAPLQRAIDKGIINRINF